jgi:thioredoxin 1
MAGNVLEFTTANWDQEVVGSGVPVLVDFWAPWCGPCRQLTPVIERLADQYAGRVKVGKLNTDDNQDIAVNFGISSIPTLLFFKGGDQPRDRLVGVRPEADLKKMLDRLIEG